MSATLEQLQHRCTRCYRTLTSELAEVGTEKPCDYCGQALLVPDPETVAADYGTAYKARPREQSFGSESAMAGLAGFTVGNNHPLAPLWKRFVGSFVDNLLLLVAFIAGVCLFGFLMSQGFLDKRLVQSKEFNLQQLNAQATIYFPVIGLLLMQWNLIATRGQSLGKMLLGMKIVDRQGGNPGFVSGVVLRNWLCYALNFIPLFGFIDAIVIFGESRRCIHDFIAGTHVVDCWE